MKSVVEDRLAGMSYIEIAAKYGIHRDMAKYHCKRAMTRGEVTAEQIKYKPQIKRRPHKAPYTGLYERLVRRIRKDANGCWLWTGPYWGKRPWPQNRYGYISVWTGKRYRTMGTHRAMLIAMHGPLRPDQCACHRCDVPLCINPEHLFVGSMRDNIHDSRSKNRHHEAKKDHCDRGHPLFGDNVRVGKQGLKIGIRRVCKTCEAGRRRMRAGWPEDLAFSIGILPHNYTLDLATRQIVEKGKPPSLSASEQS